GQVAELHAVHGAQDGDGVGVVGVIEVAVEEHPFPESQLAGNAVPALIGHARDDRLDEVRVGNHLCKVGPAWHRVYLSVEDQADKDPEEPIAPGAASTSEYSPRLPVPPAVGRCGRPWGCRWKMSGAVNDRGLSVESCRRGDVI